MKLDDLLLTRLGSVDIDIHADRAMLETLAMALARREYELHELVEHLEREQHSFAELRAILLKTLWPRTPE